MKRSVSIGVAAGIILVFAVSSPAHADTVTTSTVPAATVGDITSPPFATSFSPSLPAGPVTFPVTVVVPLSATPGATFAPGLPAAGCSRVVNSFTIAVSTPSSITAVGLQAGNYVNSGFVDATNYTHTGDGVVVESGGVLTLGFYPTVTTQAAQLTHVYPTPVAPADMYQLVAFLQAGTWMIESAEFSVTDTCPDSAAAAGAAGGPTLAASGVDAMPLGVAGSALVLAGLLLTANLRRRRAGCE